MSPTKARACPSWWHLQAFGVHLSPPPPPLVKRYRDTELVFDASARDPLRSLKFARTGEDFMSVVAPDDYT